jgi:homoserine dehydrogenase
MSVLALVLVLQQVLAVLVREFEPRAPVLSALVEDLPRRSLMSWSWFLLEGLLPVRGRARLQKPRQSRSTQQYSVSGGPASPSGWCRHPSDISEAFAALQDTEASLSSPFMERTIGIGLLGAGTVGGTLVRRLVGESEAIAAKTGLRFDVRRIGVRDLGVKRGFEVTQGLLTDDPFEVVNDPSVDLVVEVMGGLDPAGDLILAALNAGKPVVTANKELIAKRGPELIDAAERSGVPLLFEAAVGGGIPIIRPLSETLAGESIDRVLGIVNGTTNYVLTRMSEDGATYTDALSDAQVLGFAEPDPTADVSGSDAAAKAAILASLAFGTWVDLSDVYTEGIEDLSQLDMTFADEFGYVIKLIAVCEQTNGRVNARVHPAMIPVAHPLASIRGATNAVFIEGPSIDSLLFSGPGAGGEPTATAVLGDVIDAARETLAGAQVAPRIRLSPGDPIPFDDVPSRWYIRLRVDDQPGVLAKIATSFGEAGVSIRSVWQEGVDDEASLIIVTHVAEESRHRVAIADIGSIEEVIEVGSVIRVLDDEQ